MIVTERSPNMKCIVVSEDNHNEVWATGFYGEVGKRKAQERIDEGYYHRYMYKEDKSKKLIVKEV